MRHMTDTINVETIPSENRAEAFTIRQKVFVEEQQVPEELEIDAYEQEATHFLAYVNGVPAGTARMRWEDDQTAKAERVAVLAHFRGTGVGRALMHAIEREAKHHKAVAVKLNAQITAQPFYERLGYEAYGAPFFDAGIEHIAMTKKL